MMKKKFMVVISLIIVGGLSLITSTSGGFESDELVISEEELGVGGGLPLHSPVPAASIPRSSSSSSRKRKYSDPDSDSKVQFTLEHAFGDSDFAPAGSFSARLKSSIHGSQTLTKLRFSRNAFTQVDKDQFQKLLEGDEFYRIRLPSNVLSPPGKDYVISAVKARCLSRESLDEHFVIHMEGVNVLAVNYGAPGACPFPRQMRLPSKWSFNSHTVLKNTEQAPRTPLFTEAALGGENEEGEAVQPPERSFWAKYWMYLIPLGLIVMNAMTQAMNMPEEQATGQSGSQPAAAVQHGPSSAVRRR